jgi:predicted metalloprotease with PDZ domain
MRHKAFSAVLVFCLFIGCQQEQPQHITISYTVSMENPGTHYFHVEMNCTGIHGDFINLKLPAWTPGYYWILDFAKNVTRFNATDADGNPLKWRKVNKNTWRIEKGGRAGFKVSYDVFAYRQSVAEPFLDDGRGFIAPTGVFMYTDEFPDQSVTVTVIPYHEWTSVNTGLDKVEGQDNTFRADNFDMLYDCPILAGDLEVSSFKVEGIEHTMAFEKPVELDITKYADDLAKIVLSATGVIGEIPYDHYTFLHMGRGGGGLEHSNSMAVFSSLWYDVTKSEGYKRWLAFIAHEYFHLFNVKRIRPVALGPFNYDRENYTRMLWVSEGMTVYYEYIILNRAGFMNRQEVLDAFTRTIRNFENAPGREFQSATSSSFDTWLNFFNRNNHTSNTTISYYDIGCALGMLLDLKIRYETDGSKSLDNVMKELYYFYHKEIDRGFTDEEFRSICEDVAGCPLDEIFEYASTTTPIDYAKYLGYAGIRIDTEPDTLPGIDPGFRCGNRGGPMNFGGSRDRGEGISVTFVGWDTPAWKAGLSVDDRIMAINGEKATSESLNRLQEKGTVEEILLKVQRRTGEKEVSFTPEIKTEISFDMAPMQDMDQKQAQVLEGWLKDF